MARNKKAPTASADTQPHELKIDQGAIDLAGKMTRRFEAACTDPALCLQLVDQLNDFARIFEEAWDPEPLVEQLYRVIDEIIQRCRRHVISQCILGEMDMGTADEFFESLVHYEWNGEVALAEVEAALFETSRSMGFALTAPRALNGK